MTKKVVEAGQPAAVVEPSVVPLKKRKAAKSDMIRSMTPERAAKRAAKRAQKLADGAPVLRSKIPAASRAARNEPMTALRLPISLHKKQIKLARANQREGDFASMAAYDTLVANYVPEAAAVAAIGTNTMEFRLRAATANRLPVPRTIHQIWVGHRPVPVTVAMWKDWCSRLGYEHRLWREADLATVGADTNPHFAKLLADRQYPAAVDIARYLVLAAHGGIYLDCDIIPCRDDCTLHDVLPMVGLAAMSGATWRKIHGAGFFVTNSFICSPPGHPVFGAILDGLDRAVKLLAKAPAWWVTGPVHLTAAAAQGTLTVVSPWIRAGSLQREKFTTEAEMWARVREQARKRPEAMLMGWKPW